MTRFGAKIHIYIYKPDNTLYTREHINIKGEQYTREYELKIELLEKQWILEYGARKEKEEKVAKEIAETIKKHILHKHTELQFYPYIEIELHVPEKFKETLAYHIIPTYI